METMRIPVAEGVELAVDAWSAVAGSALGAGATTPAPDAVLVHGLASNARMWDGVAAALAASGHAVYAMDLRGHGRSSKPDGPYDVPTVADDVAALITHLGLARPVVAGQSWGGNVVLELASRHPALVRGIVCVDGGWLEPGLEFPDWDACRVALSPPRLAGRRLDEVEGHIRAAHPDWPESGIAGVLGNFEVFADGTIAPWLAFDRHVEVLRGMWAHRPSELYAGLAVPVLLVPAHGDDGERARRQRLRVAAAATSIPLARVRAFTGDHDIHAQFPDELAGVMHELTTDGFFA